MLKIITEMTESEAGMAYDEFLREVCSDNSDGSIFVCGVEMDCVRVLKEMDPDAYNEGFWDWVSSNEIDIVDD